MTKYLKQGFLIVAANENNSMYVTGTDITITTLQGVDFWIEQGAIEITKKEFLSELESTNKNIESFTQQITN